MIAIDRSVESNLRHVSVNGTDLAYSERGAGESVVLVHGGISDLTIWDTLVEPLSRSRRVFAYSRRYAWPNRPIGEAVDDRMDVHVRDLVAFIEQLQIGPAHLVGNSWGGFITILAARERPDLVRSLVVQEPPVIPLFLGAPPGPLGLVATLATKPRLGRALAGMLLRGLVPAGNLAKQGKLEQSIELFARRVALGDAGYDAIPPSVKEHMLVNGGTHRSQMMNGGGFVPFTRREARAITTPTLVMTGAESPIGLRLLASELGRLLPNSRQVSIPKASHVMHVANPGATLEAIEAFLASRAGGRSGYPR